MTLRLLDWGFGMNWDNVGPIPKPDIPYTMTCPSCGALMVKEPMDEDVENDGQLYPAAWTWVYQCDTCGGTLSCCFLWG